MNNELIRKIEIKVKNACYGSNNIFGKNIWDHHIVSVVRHSIALAGDLDIDLECAILSAYLHDYASVINSEYYENHHIYGAQLADEILNEEGYPKEKIEIVKKCILNHRGSINKKDNSPEIICLSNADAMAHVTEVPSLLYLAYTKKGMSVDDGRRWVLNKINRSWNKMSDEARNIIANEYAADLIILKGNE